MAKLLSKKSLLFLFIPTALAIVLLLADARKAYRRSSIIDDDEAGGRPLMLRADHAELTKKIIVKRATGDDDGGDNDKPGKKLNGKGKPSRKPKGTKKPSITAPDGASAMAPGGTNTTSAPGSITSAPEASSAAPDGLSTTAPDGSTKKPSTSGKPEKIKGGEDVDDAFMTELMKDQSNEKVLLEKALKSVREWVSWMDAHDKKSLNRHRARQLKLYVDTIIPRYLVATRQRGQNRWSPIEQMSMRRKVPSWVALD